MTAQELKNSILQLAVQGKLVPQCKDDEPASELLKRIRAEKEKPKKKDGRLPKITEDEIPFDIPENWEWIRLNDIASITSGGTPARTNSSFWNGNISWVKIGDIKNKYISTTEEKISEQGLNSSSAKVFPKGTILYTIFATIGTVGILNIDAATNQAVAGVTFFGEYSRDYMYYVLIGLKDILVSKGKGMAQMNINLTILKNTPIPIPPIAEQKRIVAKLEELMPLVEAYGKAEEQLSKLNAEFPDKLRKSILQQAVQGKLTERDPADEPALELLKRIRDTKKKLVAKGEVYREKELTSILDDDMPFDLPDSWCWCKLGEITKLITKGSSPSWQGVSYTTQEKGILFVTSENVGVNEMLLEKRKYIEAKFNEMHPASILQKGDLLTNIVGASIGRTALFQEEIDNANINQAVCIIRLIDTTLTQYLLMYLNSSTAIGFMVNKSVESARANLSLTAVTNLMVPLPPLAEQKRIVKRVEELLALCDEMKGV